MKKILVCSFLFLVACKVDPYCLNCGEPGIDGSVVGLRDGAMDGQDAQPLEDAVEQDVPSEACASPTEFCNNLDDDCDGNVDEGFDLNMDRAHCGACGRTCAPAHSFAVCQSGTCDYIECDVGYLDLDGNRNNGCEYRCSPTATNDQECNLRDDDCDGRIDENVMTDSDVNNCGSCRRRCVLAHATEICSMGMCDVQTCDSGYLNLDGIAENGCEYSCVPSGPDICNLRDDDCDGRVDEADPMVGTSCGSDTGECAAGMVSCIMGALGCSGAVDPMFEVCDGRDNDCDGTLDNGYDLLNDSTNCGMCGRACALPFAYQVCSAGSCAIAACEEGHVDRNGMASDGCEFACNITGVEVCNGVNDDCDFGTDEGLTPPPNFCGSAGVCAATAATCSGASGWSCTLPSTYEAVETRCDNLDNDCDGSVDESHPQLGDTCNNGGIGGCYREGVYVCNATGNGTVCTAPPPVSGTTETCNGIDDDCDGRLDEGAPTQWTSFTLSGGEQRWVMRYEASRPDANSSSTGRLSHRVCSEPDRLPWTNVTYAEAQAACALVGAQLCTETEWQRSCETSAGTACTYSYASGCNSYDGNACNGNDFDTNSMTPGDQDDVRATASMANCYVSWSGSRIYDLSGNVEEWTQARSPGVNPIRGGSATDPYIGLRCGYNFAVAGDSYRSLTTGFRCCRSTAP